MAIMGRGLQDGVITRLYENEEGIFVNNNPDAFDPRYEGDLIWVDYNKDGYIDLIVSGLDNTDNPATTIYENQARNICAKYRFSLAKFIWNFNGFWRFR